MKEYPKGETVENVVSARFLVESLISSLREGEMGLRTLPGLMRAVLREGAWREREIRTKKIVKFDRFVDFITRPPLEGLGEKPEQIKRLLNEDPEVLAMFEAAIVGKPGRNWESKKGNGLISDNVTNKKSDRGNSQAYTLRRLAKDRPDLFEQVKAKALTANQAAIQAGFRKVKTPVEGLHHSWDKASQEEREAFLIWATAQMR